MTRKFCLLVAFCLAIATFNAHSSALLTTAFDDASDLTDVWTVIDADNDGNTWQHGQLWGKDDNSNKRLGAEIYRQPTTMDDWLISPAVELSSGTTSLISAKFFTTYYSHEYLEVRLAAEGVEPKDATVVGKIEFKGSEGGYYGKAIEKSLAIPAVEADGKYRICLHYTAEGSASGYQDGMHINDFSWTAVENKATISGHVTYRMDMMGMPYDMDADNATVTIGDFTTKTDNNGDYTITGIPAGEYDITVKYMQGASIGKEHVTLNAGDNITVDFILTQVFKYDVTGAITDKDGMPIKGATINFAGYDTVTVVSGDDGIYTANMFESPYNVTVRKNNYLPQSLEITLDGEDLAAVNFELDIDVLPPYSVSAADDADRNIVVEWVAPKSLYEIAYDNGTAASDYGFGTYSSEDHIMGTIFRETGTLYEVSWQSAEYADGSANNLTMSIIALDADGNPTANVLYQEVVPTIHGVWNTYQLPSPITVEEGGFMVVFGGVNARLALDSGNEDDVIDHPRTQVYSNMGTESPLGYSYFDDRLSNRTCHFLIRAKCENIEEEGSTMPEITYNVWRMDAQASQDDESQWTPIATGTSALTVTDNGAHSGSYRYAVKATYTALGTTTEAVFSDVVEHNLIADVTVNVTANSDPSHANGAKVTLDGDNGSYTATVENGKAEFTDVNKGIYTLAISKNGFKPLEEEGLEIIGDDVAFTRDYELTQSLDKPISLDVLVDETSARLMWNMQPNIVEDFDSDATPDFEVNPAGSFGWQYIDNDWLIPYSFGQNADYDLITFPHMGERMAAITFNSTATTPPLNVPNTARSGYRALAFFAAKPLVDEEGGIMYQWNDDFFISPELAPYCDFTFRFYARQYEHRYNYDDAGNPYIDESRTERFMVGYSTTDATAESFTWLDEDWRKVEEVEYVKYEYTIPKEAKYVALRSSSNDNFMLLVDDVFIGVEGQVVGNSYMPVNVTGYEVYLDNAKVTDTQDTEYTFTGLADGTHTAAVVQKFATGNAEPLEITFNIGTSGIDGMATDMISIYTVGKTLYINGDYSQATVYSIAGAQVMSLSGESQADISALSRGIYVVKATTANGEAVTAKVIR